MQKYNFIYIVVIYKNATDLIDLRKSIIKQNQPYRIVIVNNYADDQSLQEIRELVSKFDDMDLVEEDNRGYGAGNNAGVEFASKHYKFDYIVICNSDTIIEQLDVNLLDPPSESAIYAPEITCRTGKKQNPHWVFYSALAEKMQYEACERENVILDYMAIALLKIPRMIFQKMGGKSKRRKIYSAHGAFLILSNAAIEKLKPLYDEKMFLFYEEVYLANRAKERGVETYYVPQIKVFHKEDGSMKVSNVNQRKVAHQSVIYYYKNKKAHN